MTQSACSSNRVQVLFSKQPPYLCAAGVLSGAASLPHKTLTRRVCSTWGFKIINFTLSTLHFGAPAKIWKVRLLATTYHCFCTCHHDGWLALVPTQSTSLGQWRTLGEPLVWSMDFGARLPVLRPSASPSQLCMWPRAIALIPKPDKLTVPEGQRPQIKKTFAIGYSGPSLLLQTCRRGKDLK